MLKLGCYEGVKEGMADCVFCLIRDGEIPSERVYEDDDVLAFKDVNPQAPVHVLVIPKKHIASLNEIQVDDGELHTQLLLATKAIAAQLNMAEDGYRVVVNTGDYGGQTVDHLHFHLLGGRSLTWPPG